MKKLLYISLVIAILLPAYLLAESEVVDISDKLQCRWQLNSGPEIFNNRNGIITKTSFSKLKSKNKRANKKLKKKLRKVKGKKKKAKIRSRIKANKSEKEDLLACESGTLEGLSCLGCV